MRKKFGLEPVNLGHFLVTKSGSGSIKEYLDRVGSHPSSLREDVFYDAEEGANDSSDDSASSDYMQDNEDYDEGAIRQTDDEGDGVFDDDDDDDYDDPDPSDKTSSKGPTPQPTTNTSQKPPPSYEESNPAEPSTKSKAPVPIIKAEKQLPVVRRKTLPAPTISMENISVMSILRNNVGKDLSTVAMPIALNEPLNLLQKLCEELEYCELLDQAAGMKDPIDRIILVAAFAVSGYASTVNRAGRKPFNPLLGETYEMIREDKGFKFVSEKVSHHPPIMASHAESAKYTVFQDNLVKTKFWGKSMELIPSGLGMPSTTYLSVLLLILFQLQ
jgi:hypothetical protein